MISFLLEHFSKKPTSHKPSGIESKSKKLLQVILYLSTFPKKFVARNLLLKDFSISLLQPSSYLRKLNKTLFFNWSLPGFILQRLCSRQVPHVASHPGSLYPGISDLPLGLIFGDARLVPNPGLIFGDARLVPNLTLGILR